MRHSLTGAAQAADLSAVILAGGLGTRLRSVIADRPKVLAPVAGRPFLAYLLDQVEQAGLRWVVLCTGYLGDQVQREFGSAYGALSLTYSPEPEPLGTGGALRWALPNIVGERCLVMNGDSYIAADLPAYLHWSAARQFAGTLLLNWVENTARYGTVEVDADGIVRQFREKQGLAVPGWINAGLYLLSRSLLEALPARQPLSLERQLFTEWIPLGLGGFQTRAEFIDIGTPESFAWAQEYFARKRTPEAKLGAGNKG